MPGPTIPSGRPWAPAWPNSRRNATLPCRPTARHRDAADAEVDVDVRLRDAACRHALHAASCNASGLPQRAAVESHPRATRHAPNTAHALAAHRDQQVPQRCPSACAAVHRADAGSRRMGRHRCPDRCRRCRWKGA
ncbi:hypothetical protein XFF6990_90022 [Xanthomonas citri pv. fuscans]|nr:hypothetical protein XFF6990_90022 [Xanthomonas citri pv. fuscans]